MITGIRGLPLVKLHNAVCGKCFFGAHPRFEDFPDQFFPTNFLQCGLEDFGFSTLGNYAHAVQIAIDDITWRDSHSVNGSRDAKIDDFATRTLILGIGDIGERRKIEM